MGIIFKNSIIKFISLLFVCLFLFLTKVQTQTIKKIDIDNLSNNDIDKLIIQFWEKTHDVDSSFLITNISDLSINNIQDKIPNQTYSYYLPIDTSFYKLCRDSSNIVRFLAHTSAEIQQLLISNKEYIILVDMRHPLPSILNNLALLSNVTESFKIEIMEQAKNLHKSNWCLRHWNDLMFESPWYYDEENDVYMSNLKDYNPNEW